MIHLTDVYIGLAKCIVSITIGTFISIFFDIFKDGTVPFVGSLLLFLLLGFTPDRNTNVPRRMAYLLGFAGSMGLLMGPFVAELEKNTPNVIPTACRVTFSVFVTLTVCALLSRSGYWLFLRRPLLRCLSFLVYLNIGNIVFGGAFLLEQIDLYMGLPVMCGYVLYDTQLINAEVLQGNRDHVLQALSLLINLIGIFVRVSKIQSQWRSSKKV